MTRNLFFITIGFVVLVTTAIFIFNSGVMNKRGKELQMKKNMKKTENMVIEEEYEKYFSNAKFITVSKVVRTIEERPDGEIFTSYDEYYISDIDYEANSDYSENYSKAMYGEIFNSGLVEKDSFENMFEFSYENKNAWEIYEKLLKTNHVVVNLDEAVLDEEIYKITGQKIYYIKADDSLWEYMLEGTVYDEIIEKKVSYQEEKTEDDVLYPDCFVATVVYSESEWKVTKSMFLQVIVN